MMNTTTITLKKIYILDTNVLIFDPKALFGFPGQEVGIPSTVLEELDKFKKEATDRGRNTRHAIRYLDALRAKGHLAHGVEMEGGGILRVLFSPTGESVIMPFRAPGEDNEILYTLLSLKQQGYHVIFISKDLNFRVKADVLGIESQDYLKEHITQEEFYRGWVRIPVPAVQLKQELPERLQKLGEDFELEINQFIVLESQHNAMNFRIFRHLGGGRFKPVYKPQLRWTLEPRNAQQLMALDLLLDSNVQFVTLFGPAGTGKTFLALLAGTHEVLVHQHFQKLLISRPVVPLGRDIGYLPGTLQEKLHSWMLPIYDNMEFIAHAAQSNSQQEQVSQEQRQSWQQPKKRVKRSQEEQKNGKNGLLPLDELIHRGKVSLEAITYMRGRSIPFQYILIDEAQNLTPHEVKTIITRVGEGSKIVLVGDPYQIDSPYMDFGSNGLVRSSERFKGQNVFGSVYLETSERSVLSKLAGELL